MWFIRDYHVNNGEMKGLKVVWSLPDGTSRILYADRAARTNNVWSFLNAQEYMTESNSVYYVPVVKTNVLAMPEFDETPQGIYNEMNLSYYLGLGEMRTLDVPINDILAYLERHPNLPRADKRPAQDGTAGTPGQARSRVSWWC